MEDPRVGSKLRLNLSPHERIVAPPRIENDGRGTLSHAVEMHPVSVHLQNLSRGRMKRPEAMRGNCVEHAAARHCHRRQHNARQGDPLNGVSSPVILSRRRRIPVFCLSSPDPHKQHKHNNMIVPMSFLRLAKIETDRNRNKQRKSPGRALPGLFLLESRLYPLSYLL